MAKCIAATADVTQFDNAIIGEGSLVEPDVTAGFRYHQDCGPTSIGKNAILRKGTLIYGDVHIGDYFQSGHYAVIRAFVRAGDYCTVCNHSCIEGGTRMGNAVRLMSGTYIPTRTWIGDHVFIGPRVTFLNGHKPGRVRIPPRGPTIEDEVMIGGGSLILPGITIGRRSFIAAGAVVTKDIPPRSLVKGIPGRIEPLPEELDCDMDLEFMIQPVDLWHPEATLSSSPFWPDDWPEHWQRPPSGQSPASASYPLGDGE